MNPKKLKNLFLSQSSIDSWDDYKRSLTKSSFTTWDYIILTASNEEQAATYRMQIQNRIEKGLLPGKIHYSVLPDPNGERVGSGGATFNVLKYVADIEKQKGNRSENLFKGRRVLVIHSGGDSKRIPQYSACGKLFSPVPRMLPDGRRATLFDEFIISMSAVAGRIKDGMLVLSGDVLLLFNPLQVDFHYGEAAAISIKEDVDTGKNHGVFLSDTSGNIRRFLHKNTVERLTELGAVNDNGEVDIDTGAVVFNSDVVKSLYGLVDNEEDFSRFVNPSARISFYADFLYPLAAESTLDGFYDETPEGQFTPELKECRTKIWNALSPYGMRIINLSPAKFMHFGTTGELLKLMTDEIFDYEFLGWRKQVNHNKDIVSNCAVSNGIVDADSIVPDSCYIEDSIIKNCVIGNNCVISNLILENVTVPDNTVLHGLKLKDGKCVVRKYGTYDDPKKNDLWTEKLFFAADSFEDSLNGKGDYMTGLCDSFNNADTAYMQQLSESISNEICAHNFIYNLKNKIPADTTLAEAGELTEELKDKIIELAKKCDFTVLMRAYYYLSKVDKSGEELESLAFSTLKDAVVNAADDAYLCSGKAPCKDSVQIELPVRVNFGGGWSDTPPYCLENGGTVLNCTIKLNGSNPIRVTIKKMPEKAVIFESVDSGDITKITDMGEIIGCSGPFDPFALHKAAFEACGVVNKDNNTVFKNMDCGIYMSTEVDNVPRGSGLGTSSILCAACAKAIFRFFGVDAPDSDVFEAVMKMEQIMSTGGGWQDQVGGVVPGMKYLSTNPGLKQNVIIEHVRMPEEAKKQLQERFVLVYTGQRRLARNLLRKVTGAYIAGTQQSVNTLYKIQQLSALMKFELEKGNIDNFAKLLSEHWELSKMLDAECTNTCIDQILLVAEEFIDGKFIAGAGGGGFLQLILKKNVSKDDLKKRLNDVFGNSGIDVWDAELVF